MCTENWLTVDYQLAQEKSVVRLTDHLSMTIAVDWDVKPQDCFCIIKIIKQFEGKR